MVMHLHHVIPAVYSTKMAQEDQQDIVAVF
jgi:hypothetical protein